MGDPQRVLDAAGDGAPEPAAGFVVFALAGRAYALPVEDVVGVVRMVAITELPESPTWLAGVIDVRGRVVPVIDLRTRLRLAPPDVTLSTPIVLAGDVEPTAGLIVDTVEGVLQVPAGSVAAPTDLAGEDHSVAAMVRTADRMILVLDLPRLVASVPEPATQHDGGHRADAV